MKILVTGICGFFGSQLALELLEQNPEITVYGTDNFIRAGSERNRNKLQKKGIRFFYGDIRTQADVDALPPVDWVIDAAALPRVGAGIDGQTSSRQLIEHNLQGTVNILEYCKRHRAGLILISTSRVYSISQLSALPVEAVGSRFALREQAALPAGASSAGISEGFSTAPPLSLYGSSKLASEILALEYGEAFGFPVWINRCGVLAGAGQFGRADQGIFSYWIHAYSHRRPLTYLGFAGSGHQVRDCLHPRDLTILIRKQLLAPAMANRVFNIGGGYANSMSLAELSSWCADRFGPHTISGDLQQRQFDIPWMIMDSSLAAASWDWRPATPLLEILNELALHAENNPDWIDLTEGI